MYQASLSGSPSPALIKTNEPQYLAQKDTTDLNYIKGDDIEIQAHEQPKQYHV